MDEWISMAYQKYTIHEKTTQLVMSNEHSSHDVPQTIYLSRNGQEGAVCQFQDPNFMVQSLNSYTVYIYYVLIIGKRSN